MNFTCDICKKNLVLPSGYSQSKILLIGDCPEKGDVRPFSDEASKEILRKEMLMQGLDFIQCRTTNLWLHVPEKKQDKKKKEQCLQASVKACLNEAKGKEAILLVGGDTVRYFTEYGVLDVNGLQVESSMLSASIIYACVKPSRVYSKGIGELRFALTNFIEHLKREEIL